jgi:hypothetical protein
MKSLLISLNLMVVMPLYAQQDTTLPQVPQFDESSTFIAKNIVHANIGIIPFLFVLSVGGSINYERMLNETFSIRAGYGTAYTMFFFSTTYFSKGGILMLNAMTKGDRKLEGGFGITLTSSANQTQSNSLQPVYACFTIGYRYQTQKGGLIFRTGLCGIVNMEVGLFLGWGIAF